MPIRKLGFVLAVTGALMFAATPVEIEKKIDALLARMTIEEKLGQMSQASFPSGLPQRARDEIRKGRWGSFLNGGTPQEKAEAQRIATKESRLGIPIIYGQDVIHGYRWANRPVGIRNWSGGPPESPHGKHRAWAFTGPSLRCWISHATRAGGASPNR